MVEPQGFYIEGNILMTDICLNHETGAIKSVTIKSVNVTGTYNDIVSFQGKHNTKKTCVTDEQHFHQSS